MKVAGRVLPHSLELRHNAAWGYHIVTTRALEAGTVLCHEAPLAVCPATESLTTHCRRCLDPVPLRVTTDPYTCSACMAVVYCSRRCRSVDRQEHVYSGECCLMGKADVREALGDLLREACITLRLLHIQPPLHPPLSHHEHRLYNTQYTPPDDVARLHAAAGAMRDALLHTHTHLLHNNAPATSTSSSSSSDGGGNDRDGDNDNNDNNDDKDNKDDYYNKHDDNDQAAQQNTTTKQQAHDPAATHTITPHTTTTPHTNGNTSTPPTPAVYAVQLHGDKDGVLQGVVRQQLAAVVANALEIHPVLVSGDLTGGPHAGAAAVYRLGCRLNHSCRPNVMWCFKPKTQLVLRTLCNIPAGTQLCISYHDVTLAAPQRQERLMQQYGFWCCCARCGGDAVVNGGGDAVVNGGRVGRVVPADWVLSGCMHDGQWWYTPAHTMHDVGQWSIHGQHPLQWARVDNTYTLTNNETAPAAVPAAAIPDHGQQHDGQQHNGQQHDDAPPPAAPLCSAALADIQQRIQQASSLLLHTGTIDQCSTAFLDILHTLLNPHALVHLHPLHTLFLEVATCMSTCTRIASRCALMHTHHISDGNGDDGGGDDGGGDDGNDGDDMKSKKHKSNHYDKNAKSNHYDNESTTCSAALLCVGWSLMACVPSSVLLFKHGERGVLLDCACRLAEAATHSYQYLLTTLGHTTMNSAQHVHQSGAQHVDHDTLDVTHDSVNTTIEQGQPCVHNSVQDMTRNNTHDNTHNNNTHDNTHNNKTHDSTDDNTHDSTIAAPPPHKRPRHDKPNMHMDDTLPTAHTTPAAHATPQTATAHQVYDKSVLEQRLLTMVLGGNATGPTKQPTPMQPSGQPSAPMQPSATHPMISMQHDTSQPHTHADTTIQHHVHILCCMYDTLFDHMFDHGFDHGGIPLDHTRLLPPVPPPLDTPTRYAQHGITTAQQQRWLHAAFVLHATAAGCATVAVGETHALADRISFLQFFAGVPTPLASTLAQSLPRAVGVVTEVVKECMGAAGGA